MRRIEQLLHLHGQGEDPEHRDQIPGYVQTSELPHSHGLVEEVKSYLAKNLRIVRASELLNKDIVPVNHSYGRGFYIGIGVAASLAATGIVIEVIRRKRAKGGRSKFIVETVEGEKNEN